MKDTSSGEIEKKYFTIGEVARMFEVAPSLIRFWETHFDNIKPRKTKNGIRQYTQSDSSRLRTIYHLVKNKGYTLQGAKEALSSRSDDKDKIVQTIDELQSLKTFLEQLRMKLD
jgi:DNA-binding transcriptional MerR regulator